MSHNIYDTQEFFENYSKLDRSVRGLDGAPEWPDIQKLLPADLAGRRVLDLGCGFGWFVRWARDQGASHVHGIDLSENMLEQARGKTRESPRGFENITYQRADLDTIVFPETEASVYDLVFSVLTLHYLANLRQLVAQVQHALKPGGAFVFTIEHPIWTAPSNPKLQVDAETGRKYWPLDDYQIEGPRVTNWLAQGFGKQHRTLTSYINILLEAGFELTGFNEWCPTEAQLQEHPEWAGERLRPSFLLMSARKK
ncbi:methyl transferase [Thozetella sp. PMI_491]|nr:methyl transferase [Thozetella sp. PMI_491]